MSVAIQATRPAHGVGVDRASPLRRAFTFWLPLIPGVIAYFPLRRTVHRWRGQPVLH